MTELSNIEKIAVALAKAQGKFPSIPMNGKAGKDSYGYRYATLADLIQTVAPILSEHELSFTQLVSGSGDDVTVTTILMHSSGQHLQSSFTAKASGQGGRMTGIQAQGSTITYLKRYLLAAMLGVAGEEDTDGVPPVQSEPRNQNRNQQGQGRGQQNPQQSQPKPQQATSNAAPPPSTLDKVITHLANRFGFPKDDDTLITERLSFMAFLAGRTPAAADTPFTEEELQAISKRLSSTGGKQIDALKTEWAIWLKPEETVA